MVVLVTGGAGYIGSHVCKALHAAGHRVVALDNLSRGNRWAVRWGVLEEHSIGDAAAVADTLRRWKIDAVIHLAAFAYVGESMTQPELYYRNNVAGSLALLDAVVGYGSPAIIFSSSCATYGVPDRLPLDEAHPQRPTNPYGHSKLIIEQVLQWYGRLHGLRWVSLRYFNAAGADPEGDVGEWHAPETHLIPLAMEAALRPEEPLTVFGTDYPTQDGTAVRDFTHVSDLADAHLRALEWLARGGESAAFNLGSGRGHSVRDVIQAVEQVTGRPVATRWEQRRAGDPPELVASAGRARTELGWKDPHSSLQTILETAWRWRTEHLSLRTAQGR